MQVHFKEREKSMSNDENKKKNKKKKTMATHVFQPIKCLKNKHTKG
jgi:hypothetical protein